MEIASRERAEAFTTLDGSTIRVLLDACLGRTRNQSLAEATLAPGQATQRHYHAETEEIHAVLAGSGEMEWTASARAGGPATPSSSRPGVAPDPRARRRVRFLCCCAPPYSDADTFFA